MAERRLFRLTVHRLDEWVAIQPFLAGVRRTVEKDQEGHCRDCLEGRQLMLAYDEGMWVGMCPTHHADWLEGGRNDRRDDPDHVR